MWSSKWSCMNRAWKMLHSCDVQELWIKLFLGWHHFLSNFWLSPEMSIISLEQQPKSKAALNAWFELCASTNHTQYKLGQIKIGRQIRCSASKVRHCCDWYLVTVTESKWYEWATLKLNKFYLHSKFDASRIHSMINKKIYVNALDTAGWLNTDHYILLSWKSKRWHCKQFCSPSLSLSHTHTNTHTQFLRIKLPSV